MIRPSDNLELDLGLDSMQRIELLVALEKELGGDVEESSHGGNLYRAPIGGRDSRECSRRQNSHQFTSQQPAGWKSVLQEDPTDPEVLALARPGRFAERVLFARVKPLQIFAYDRFHLRVSGLEKLPAQGPYIISSNHQSFLDPVVLGSRPALASIP